MSETITVTEEVVAENGTRMKEMAQKTFYAGVGAADMAREEAMSLVEKVQERFSTAQDDAQELFEKFVDRGMSVEKDSRKQLDKTVASQRKQARRTVKEAQANLESRIETVLHSMNVPTRSDIDQLTKKINALTRKVNALAKEMKQEG